MELISKEPPTTDTRQQHTTTDNDTCYSRGKAITCHLRGCDATCYTGDNDVICQEEDLVNVPKFLNRVYEELKGNLCFNENDFTAQRPDVQTAEATLLALENIISLLRDVTNRIVHDILPEGSLKERHLPLLSVDFKQKRDSGISSARASSQWSSASCLSDNMSVENADSDGSQRYGSVNRNHSANKDTLTDEPCMLNSGNEIHSEDGKGTKRDVQFFLDSKDIDLSRLEKYNSLCKFIVTSSLLPDTEECRDNLSTLSNREIKNKTLTTEEHGKSHHSLVRQKSVDLSSTASLQEYIERSSTTKEFRRGTSECVLHILPVGGLNNLSRVAIQHSESSDDDNNHRRICAQISSSSSGGSLHFMPCRRPEIRSMYTQTDMFASQTAGH